MVRNYTIEFKSSFCIPEHQTKQFLNMQTLLIRESFKNRYFQQNSTDFGFLNLQHIHLSDKFIGKCFQFFRIMTQKKTWLLQKMKLALVIIGNGRLHRSNICIK